MTLNDIMKALYFKKEAYFVDMFGKIKCNKTTLYNDRNNCSSQKHIERWLSMNDLLNVAHFLNNGWKPDWQNMQEEKFIIVIQNGTAAPQKTNIPASFVYFSSEKTATLAIEILGEKQLLQLFAD
ncbi:MAG: hypothetical protein LBH82_05540 [Bacteroidales bacterium]|nr:hypothetical protein [Bacteroidales bacterium]